MPSGRSDEEPPGIFWACVSTGELPARAGSPVGVPAHALPASLVHPLLLHEARLSEGEVAHLTLAAATAIMVERWSAPG